MSATEVNEIVSTTFDKSGSIFSLLTSADVVAGSVMVLLIIISIWSWAVILDKILRLNQIKTRIATFEGVFWSGQILDQLYESIKGSIDSPLAAIFVGAMNECKRSSKRSNDALLKIGQKERILQSMHLIKDRELERLETNLTFLATVGSSSTFIGLFGTVWGIMQSFQSIAISKNTTLAVVAPGIAEALLATAIGLFAAIPAVIFHSYLTNKVILLDNKMNDFIGELNTLLSRAIDEEKI